MTDDDSKPELDARDTPPWLMPVADEEDADKRGFIMSNLGAIVSTLFVAASAAGLVYLYQTYNDGENPVKQVAAPTQAAKEKPADPGGKEIPDQDKKVFDQMQGKAEKGGVVDVAKQPEEPVKELPKNSESEKDATKSEAKEETKSEAKAEPKPESKAEAKTAPKVEPKATPKVEPKAEPKATPKVSSTDYGFYRVQLGSFFTDKAANDAWTRIKSSQTELTQDMKHYINQAQVSGRTYYRLSMGPLSSRTAADNVCLYFKTRGQACFVVSPSRK